MRLLEERGYEIILNPFGRPLDESEIMDHLKDVDGLVAGLEPLNRKVLSGAPRLKAIARVGIGMDSVDMEAAADLGIRVSNTPDAPANAVAEMTVTALLALCRGLIEANAGVHERRWDKMIGTSLSGLVVLIIGYGRTGKRVAELLAPFGPRLLVVEPYFAPQENSTVQVDLVELRDGLRQADVISLHASGSNTVLGPNEFAHTKRGAFLLNSARGGLIDENAVIAALESGQLRGAWFDAFVEEPYSGALCDNSRALLTPHMCTYTVQCRREMEVCAVENLCRDLTETKPGGAA